MKNDYTYSISQGGLLVRENDKTCHVFIHGEWEYPEASIGCQMPFTAEEAHRLIITALSNHYHSDPEYKDKIWPGC